MKRELVHQFAPQICRHDAIGNEIFAIQRAMASSGIESDIACDLADAPLPGRVRPWSKKVAETSRLTIVHYSHGSASHERVFSSSEPKVLFYHNVTPAQYFRSTHPNLVRASEAGREQLSKLPGLVEVAVAHSTFSAKELEEYGFRRVEVLPYMPLEPLYEVEPDRSVLRCYGCDGWANLICVARVSPQKCIEDCILIFDYFKHFVNRKSRLFVIGGWAGTEAYLARLHRLVKFLNLNDVIFTGQVSQESLIAYYKTAHAFLCMSEHEGFCVPLVEAMRYDIPVFAYAATAIPETLRYSGVLFPQKDWPTIAEAIGLLISDKQWREQIVAGQRQHLNYYSLRACQERLETLLASLGQPVVGEESVHASTPIRRPVVSRRSAPRKLGGYSWPGAGTVAPHALERDANGKLPGGGPGGRLLDEPDWHT